MRICDRGGCVDSKGTWKGGEECMRVEVSWKRIDKSEMGNGLKRLRASGNGIEMEWKQEW
jgi:hypothetical protein